MAAFTQSAESGKLSWWSLHFSSSEIWSCVIFLLPVETSNPSLITAHWWIASCRPAGWHQGLVSLISPLCLRLDCWIEASPASLCKCTRDPSFSSWCQNEESCAERSRQTLPLAGQCHFVRVLIRRRWPGAPAHGSEGAHGLETHSQCGHSGNQFPWEL